MKLFLWQWMRPGSGVGHLEMAARIIVFHLQEIPSFKGFHRNHVSFQTCSYGIYGFIDTLFFLINRSSRYLHRNGLSKEKIKKNHYYEE